MPSKKNEKNISPIDDRPTDNHWKIGVFGSSFNPLHLGHLNLLIQVQEKFQFDVLKVVPANKSPLSTTIKNAKERLSIVKKFFKDYSFVEVDDREIKRGGISYTVDTINSLDINHSTEVFLIIGVDQWLQFDKWKDFSEIIKKVHLLVCSRPGYDGITLPHPLKKYFSKESEKTFFKKQPKKQPKKALSVKLTTGKKMYWFFFNNISISSSQIRQRKKNGLPINHLVPPLVDKWIKKQNLYKPSQKKQEELFIKFCVDLMKDKKSYKIKVFDLRKCLQFPFDFTIVLSGLNTRHTKIIANYLQKQIKKQNLLSVRQIEGQNTGEWIVLDYGHLVIHIFCDYTREYYQLEDIWKDNLFHLETEKFT